MAPRGKPSTHIPKSIRLINVRRLRDDMPVRHRKISRSDKQNHPATKSVGLSNQKLRRGAGEEHRPQWVPTLVRRHIPQVAAMARREHSTHSDQGNRRPAPGNPCLIASTPAGVRNQHSEGRHCWVGAAVPEGTHEPGPHAILRALRQSRSSDSAIGSRESSQ